ncbi:response regulator transcription factor [Paenibacillus endoradicis]|uniref:response regulator transcription factor n=1 Tax=Paenibacillus endoradicis TaxID=2972487 RepID=UPI0021598EFC|nr:response regulator [Paenibacillus endoradicis]MCR8657295.1 response regulator [Paenibacillus endoradicis]
MYKLLIVDDEPEVTEGLEVGIDWESNRISSVYTAINGNDAIELFDRVEPDIVVTDISMPFMNGLQLTEWLKQHYPITKVIIISGYDDFQYAKQAIHLQVEEYLLKPFSNDQLLTAINKVIATIDLEREAVLNMKTLQDHYRISLPVIREKFLISLMTRRLPLYLIEQRAEKYNLNLEGKGYIISLISINHDNNDIDDEPSLSLVDSNDIDLKLFAVTNVATELWQSEQLGNIFVHQDEVVLLTIDQVGDPQAKMVETVNTLQRILQSIQKYLRMSAIISVGTYTTTLDQLKHGYDSARSGLDYRRIIDHNSIICIDDIEKNVQSRLYFDEYKEQQFIRAIKLGTDRELQQAISAIVDEIDHTQATVSEYEQYFLEIITAVHRLMKSLDASIGGQWSEGTSLLLQYQSLKSLEETKTWFSELCHNLHQSIASTRQNTSQKLVEEAIHYTKEHYMQTDLSITTLCLQLHISPGYFSGLFKKATQLTYGAYLLKIRMEMAQQLLRTTDLKSFEIADRVGFSDPNYFSLTFKKYTGVSAKDYRNAMLRKD